MSDVQTYRATAESVVVVVPGTPFSAYATVRRGMTLPQDVPARQIRHLLDVGMIEPIVAGEQAA